jgi:repressor of nif and glnA expression
LTIDLIFPAQAMITETGKTMFRNGGLVAFKVKEISARIKSIIYSIKQAVGQLSGTVPSVIYVDMSGVVHSMTDRDFERLCQFINRI